MHNAYKVSIIYFSLFTILLLTSGYMIFESKIGFNIDTAISYYLGDEAKYIAAKSNTAILKLILPHIFAFALLSMVVIHFLAFTKYKKNRLVLYVIYLTLLTQVLEVFSPFLVINLSSLFIYVKLASFFIYLALIPLVLALLFINIIKE